MKKLVFIILLISVPWLSHARGKSYFNPSSHHQQASHYSHFWDNIDERQYQQESQIKQGIHNGQLTHHEVKKLHREQHHVNKQIRYYKKHHSLSRTNKHKIVTHLDHFSDQIYHLKHNAHYVHRNNFNVQNPHNHNYSHNNRWGHNSPSIGLYLKF